MKKPLILAIYFIALVVLLDQLAGYTLRSLYFRQKAGTAYRTTYSIDSTTAEVLIFGSSRASHHYIPKVFEQHLGLSCYNTGRDGNGILYNYAVLRANLKRHKPRVVILDINIEEFAVNEKNFDNLASLLPYVKTHPEIKDIVYQWREKEQIKHLSAVYPFNSTIIETLANLMKKKDNSIAGYLPLRGSISKAPVTKESPHTPDYEKLKALELFIQSCKDIELYIVQSPRYIIIPRGKVDIALEEVIARNNARYLNRMNVPPYITDPSLFRDTKHLNNTGAKQFSQEIAAVISSK